MAFDGRYWLLQGRMLWAESDQNQLLKFSFRKSAWNWLLYHPVALTVPESDLNTLNLVLSKRKSDQNE